VGITIGSFVSSGGVGSSVAVSGLAAGLGVPADVGSGVAVSGFRDGSGKSAGAQPANMAAKIDTINKMQMTFIIAAHLFCSVITIIRQYMILSTGEGGTPRQQQLHFIALTEREEWTKGAYCDII